MKKKLCFIAILVIFFVSGCNKQIKQRMISLTNETKAGMAKDYIEVIDITEFNDEKVNLGFRISYLIDESNQLIFRYPNEIEITGAKIIDSDDLEIMISLSSFEVDENKIKGFVQGSIGSKKVNKNEHLKLTYEINYEILNGSLVIIEKKN